MTEEKSKLLAYVLWLIVGAFGGHWFYLGRIKSGIALGGLLIETFGAEVEAYIAKSKRWA